MHDLVFTKNGKPASNVDALSEMLEKVEVPTGCLDQPIDLSQDLPPPLLYAVGTKNEKLVKLLVDRGANPCLKFQGDKMWNGIIKGMTPREGASNMKGRFVGTSLEKKYIIIEELLEAAENEFQDQVDQDASDMAEFKAFGKEKTFNAAAHNVDDSDDTSNESEGEPQPREQDMRETQERPSEGRKGTPHDLRTFMGIMQADSVKINKDRASFWKKNNQDCTRTKYCIDFETK